MNGWLLLLLLVVAPDDVTSAPLCSRDEIIQILNRRQNSVPLLCPLLLNLYFNCQFTVGDLISCPKPHSPVIFLNGVKELDGLKTALNFRFFLRQDAAEST